MSLAAVILASATMVPPWDTPENHAQPYHGGAPVVRRFERRTVDDERRARWEQYTRRLDAAWRTYRIAGSTPEAWEDYKRERSRVRYEYLYYDPYLLPFVRTPRGE